MIQLRTNISVRIVTFKFIYLNKSVFSRQDNKTKPKILLFTRNTP